MICNKGINDMPRGWAKDNKRKYELWKNMLYRCYSNKYKTYIDCYVCERWLRLSNFLEDLPKIPNYNLWENNINYQLDKDIKSNGRNKCYCFEECIFVTVSINAKQARKTTNYDYLHNNVGENNPMYGNKGNKHHNSVVVVQLLNNEMINVWGSISDAERFYKTTHITECCKGNRKSVKGHQWKYISDVSDDEIKKYIINKMQIKIEVN